MIVVDAHQHFWDPTRNENAVRFYNLDEPEQGQFTPPTARAS